MFKQKNQEKRTFFYFICLFNKSIDFWHLLKIFIFSIKIRLKFVLSHIYNVNLHKQFYYGKENFDTFLFNS